MTVITTVNPSALLAVASTTTPTTPTTTTPTTTTPTTTTPTTTHYSMLQYAEIIENSYNNFFNDDIFGFYPAPVLEGFTEKDFEEMCYYKGVKDNYESLTVEKINDVASDYAEEKNLEMYELLDEGWEFIEEISKRLAIPAVLLYESDSYNTFESEIDGL